MTQSVEVLPSLTVTPCLTLTSDSLHRSLLQLTVAQPQVCSVTRAPPPPGRHWSIQGLP